MKKHKNIFYGTVKECVDEFYSLIDFEEAKMPDVDYAASVDEDAEDTYDAYYSAEGWFGFKDLGEKFNCDTITLLFAHHGGGGIESLELTGEDPETEKETIIQKIFNSTESCGYSLRREDMTVFELM